MGEPCICRLSHVLESLQDVRTLSLANNSLTSLPDSVWKLHELTSLDLARNLLVSIPAEAARMRSLEVFCHPVDGARCHSNLCSNLRIVLGKCLYEMVTWRHASAEKVVEVSKEVTGGAHPRRG